MMLMLQLVVSTSVIMIVTMTMIRAEEGFPEHGRNSSGHETADTDAGDDAVAQHDEDEEEAEAESQPTISLHLQLQQDI